MRRVLAVASVLVAVLVASTQPAAAVTSTLGNTATDRASFDTWVNFTIVDTNHPAPFDGYFTSIDYYAERPGAMRFVIVDATDTITWVSARIEASAGPGTLTLPGPVGVTAGSNLGVYSEGYGVVSFDYDSTAAPTEFEGYNAGLPALGETLTYVGSSRRVYSMNASVRASSPEICKDDGWMTYGYRNQGQCIASVVANANSGH